MHPNKHALLFLLGLISVFLHAQDYEVKGRISIHNSKETNKIIQYVKDVNVTTSVTPPVSSDYKGRFNLSFKEEDSNQTLNLTFEKTGYEVVNYQVLEHFNIDRKSLFRIYLAEKGYVEKRQKKLLYSNQKALYNHRDHLFDLLAFDNKESKAVIQELEKQLNSKIYNTIEAEEKINAEVKNIDNKLDDFSKHLATVNLDFTSSLYQKAFDFYQKGDIEKAVASLDENILDKNYNNIIAVIEKAKENPESLDKIMAIRIIQLNQIKESLVLKTIALQQLFRYQDAKSVLEKLSKVVAITGFGEDMAVLDLLKLSDTPMEEPPVEIVEKEIIKPLEKIDEVIEEEVIVEKIEEKKDPIIEEKEEPIQKVTKEITTGKLSKDDYETALLLKEKKQIDPEEIFAKGEEIVIEKKEIIKSEPVIIETPAPIIVEKKPIIIQEAKPIYVAPKKEAIIVREPIVISYDSFSITKKTSLRTLPTASSKVLKRLNVGTKVEVIEQVDKYWSKVILNGREGYVKALLLRKVN